MTPHPDFSLLVLEPLCDLSFNVFLLVFVKKKTNHFYNIHGYTEGLWETVFVKGS